MLSGIIGDGLKMKDEESSSLGNSPKRIYKQDSLTDEDLKKHSVERDPETPNFNYVHYDPELHWCRICDVFPRSTKDYLNHLQSAEHKQISQEHQLVDTPWHKLPADTEFPSFKGAPIKRISIKGNKNIFFNLNYKFFWFNHIGLISENIYRGISIKNV